MSTEPTRYWEDLEPGETGESHELSISEDEITSFAFRYDPQYFHVDPTLAKRSHFGEVVASGIHILAMWRILDHEISRDVRWMCGIGWDNLRWNKPMRAGDRVRARSELLEKRESSSDPSRGVVVLRYSLLNQDDEEIFYCTSTNLVERRPAD